MPKPGGLSDLRFLLLFVLFCFSGHVDKRIRNTWFLKKKKKEEDV